MSQPCCLVLVVSGWHVPALLFWAWLSVGGMSQPLCFGAGCEWVACSNPAVLEPFVSGWHVPTLVFCDWLSVGGMSHPWCFVTGCQWVACPSHGASTFVIITGGLHGLHGLDTNQDKISIFFKSWCPIDYQHWQLSAFNYLSSFKHCFFAKQKCNVCKQMPYLCFLMKQGYCGHHGAAIQSVEQEIDCGLW